MKPRNNRVQIIKSSFLLPADSRKQGLRVVYYANLFAVDKSRGRHATLEQLFPTSLRENPESLRQVPKLPKDYLIVMNSEHIPREILPTPAPLALARAILALSNDTLYSPDRPLITTESRITRSIVLLSPNGYFDYEY